MKKILSVLLAAALMFTGAFAVWAANNGDMDNDKQVTSADARKILRAAVDLDKLNSDQTLIADIDMDGEVTSADARAALRLAVDLDVQSGTFCANEYEVLLSGCYYARFTVPEEGMNEPVELAVTDKSTYLMLTYSDDSFKEFGISSVSLPLLFLGEDVYLLDEKNKQYGAFPAEEIGMETDDLGEFASAGMFSNLEPLSKASRSGATVNGVKMDVYDFQYTDHYVKVLMNGKKLYEIRIYNTQGVVETTYHFSRVSPCVPMQYTRLSADYTETEDALQMMFVMLFGDILKV